MILWWDNRDWSGGCPLSRSKAGLVVVIRVCWLEWRVSCDELVGWVMVDDFLDCAYEVVGWFCCLVSSGIGVGVLLWVGMVI